MFDRFRDLLDGPLRVRPEEGSSRVMPIRDAVARFVRPGMTLHATSTTSRPNALLYEVMRQHWGRDPRFTYVTISMTGHAACLVRGGLLARVITTFCGDSYPTPGPNNAFVRAYLDKTVEIENWSMLTLPLRLKAAAMGIPWHPTRSIVGSTMAEENREAFRLLPEVPCEAGADRPLSNGEPGIGLVRALAPDLSLVHALAADPAGNALLAPPYGEDVYGALAAKEGAIVSAERIVSAEYLRRHNHLVRIPSYAVRAVCLAPYGSHPSGISNRGIPELEAYAEDYAFLNEVRHASKSPERLDAWTKEWVLDVPDHEAYVRKLGFDRILFLKGKADGDSWMPELAELEGGIDLEAPANALETMIAEAARRLADRSRAEEYRTILAGVGASNLAAWLAASALRDEGRDVDLMAELGFYGYAPRPADPFIFNYRNLPTCKLLTGIETTMGIFMGGARNRCIGALGAGQVDRAGNLNSTKIPGVTYLVGSGGANDIASSAREVVVCAQQDPARFPDRVPYITSPGARVRTVVTDLGVLEKRGGDPELALTGVFADGALDPAALARRAAERCGWKLRVADDLAVLPRATPAELRLLRLWDPRRQFLGKQDAS
jgi:acyl CoA:acetate/3-ketoacid CoA transferase alpha subunit/acyl CoA:acetate/3-ketoacid CoA transferase beta subunit